MIKEFKPQLLPHIRNLSLQANRNFLSRTLTGNWLSRVKGRGIEFSGYRSYTSGDDAFLIDWRASLRSQKLLVKELSEEKNLNVFFLLDCSNSMLYGSEELLKIEVAAELVSNISYVALRSGDGCGLFFCTDGVMHYLPASIGTNQHSRIVKELAHTEHYGGKIDLRKSIAEIMGMTKERGMLIIISDFLGLPDNWNKYVEIASERFDLVGIAVRDPRDRRLPKTQGEFVLDDPYSDEKLVIDTAVYAKPYEDYVRKEESHIQEYFRQVNGDAVIIETGVDLNKALVQFFYKRSMMVGRL